MSRILSRREFWGLPLAISPDVLDPRADTETLVEAVVTEFAQAAASAPAHPRPRRRLGRHSLRIAERIRRGDAASPSISRRRPPRRRATISPPAASPGARASSSVAGARRFAAASTSSSPTRPILRATRSTGWRARSGITIPSWRSTAGPTGSTPIGRSARNSASMLGADGRFFLEFGAGQADERQRDPRRTWADGTGALRRSGGPDPGRERRRPRRRPRNGRECGRSPKKPCKRCLLAWSEKKTIYFVRIVFASLSGRELRSFLWSLSPGFGRTINRFRLTTSEETLAARLSFDHEAAC